MDWLILLPIFLPSLAGIVLLASSFYEHIKYGQTDEKKRKSVHLFSGAVLAVSAAAALWIAWRGTGSVTLFYLMEDIPVFFQVDALGSVFASFMSIVWVLVAVYSFVYMEHEGNEKRFFGVYLLVYGVLIALDFAGNLVTLYLFYELMTLTSMPMVLHNGSKASIMAALKYLFYSMCGAYLGLFGIFFLYKYCGTLSFVAGGSLNLALAAGNEGILLIAVFAMLIGFGAKAGMFPLHAWLPAAHPVAPSPASAVLSGIIVKAGVLAVIRVVYYTVGADFLRGTWVQAVWMALTLLTVFMGSLLAFREPVFKKRLAYSTVSQISYILFGLSLLTPVAVTGALLHTVFHAFIKCALFLTAGIFIFQCGKSRVEELDGIGKRMPGTLWCYTFASLALIGIPPASGFISKWYLAQGALKAGVGIFGWLGPVVLLISALLTAGYLLPVTMKGFFPGHGEAVSAEKQEAKPGMLFPLAVLAAAAVLLGVFPNPLIQYVSRIAEALM
ncbi:complex I subunit 5 family protein [Hominisplanchenecus murintestinalis]|uniref:complex I subunit 5 family protein n=1 Tax=Hominisplanchenecus murintestinalis TaxID=2941517 RepID=UPI00203DB490|nr:proton-conducting transporter membrane subunit [Hominisplanchenecus murintestinalis]